MVMEEHTLIIGNPMGADVQIMKSFFQQVQAKAEIVDPESLGHTQYTLRSLLQNWEPHYGVWQVYPAVICEARYIGGLREVQRYYQTGELKDIAMMKKKVGVQCFHDDTKKEEL
ncbi:uncharacterized protein MONOS_10538 [Monocercomonoides exilis]|uniref:uncharacterized protein n=1 Tax=Monocercomonoides exilis TaxID=2049356 RepID=UPI003559E7CF|nr:hypothetical protein MONOS_10538 [Monocercomonoides exilis]|eukprot:MONOS_10538.1-p1 / transcript=MONOS_10538.1 / gene=MONOS_10538 / organism=Monocercomonoides_exilis_PA203 / gene_product=unspecified product / transcript_product=unspecified product / location=Mono_scaffold00483:10741-11206(-) / protein_length=114 / sequence_SO=supercontig / SO=protein_coding / is_pseudo=false